MRRDLVRIVGAQRKRRFQVRSGPRCPLFFVDGEEVDRPYREGSCAAQALHEAAIWVKHLDALVPPVGNIHIALWVNGHTRGPRELPVASSRCAIAGDKRAVGRKALNAVVAPVCHIYVTIWGHGETPRQIALSSATAQRAKAEEGSSARRELLDAVIVGVGYVQVALCIAGDTGWAVELAGATPVRPPRGQKRPGRVESGHPVQVFVGDVDMALRIHRAAAQPDELTIALTIGPEGAVILAVEVAHGDPNAPIDALERAVQDVQAVVGANHAVARIVKSPPFHRR